MFIEREFHIGFQDLTNKNRVSNKAILRYLEDTAGTHLNLIGCGLNDIPRIKYKWILLGWKVELYKRPLYGEMIKVKTWSKSMHGFYSLRDFQLFNKNGDIIGIATSKWGYIDIEKGGISKIPINIVDTYGNENISVFTENNIMKLREPERFDNSCNFLIKRSFIDMNNHVHNTYYIDIANEAIPEQVYNTEEFNKFEIMYKKEILLGENVKCLYSNINNKHIITIKSQNETFIHAILCYKN